MHVLQEFGAFATRIAPRYHQQNALFRVVRYQTGVYQLLKFLVGIFNFGVLPNVVGYLDFELMEHAALNWRIIVFQSEPIVAHDLGVSRVPTNIL